MVKLVSFITVFLFVSLNSILGQMYEVKKISDISPLIKKANIEFCKQIPYNLAIWYKLKNQESLLLQVRGDLCLYFKNTKDLELMIKEENYPDISTTNYRNPFRNHRNHLNNIEIFEYVFLDELASKLNISKSFMFDKGNFVDISNKISQLSFSEREDIYIYLGIYLGVLVRENKGFKWALRQEYEGYNPNWIPYIVDNNNNKYEIWKHLYDCLNQEIFDLRNCILKILS